MSRPLGYEARVRRIEEAISSGGLSTQTVLFRASLAPNKPHFLDAVEWAVEVLTGSRVPTRGLRKD